MKLENLKKRDKIEIIGRYDSYVKARVVKNFPKQKKIVLKYRDIFWFETVFDYDDKVFGLLDIE